ncbi:MAG: tetratricopeptide repeat protein [Candidatus Omnitrophica bacterium]|nr:tetratricopeptide repeat protein [Candidatus Omnitrophota bacterium]
MKRNKPILMVLLVSFFIVSFALIGRPQTSKVREAERWGFHQIVEDFFSSKEEPSEWEKNIAGIKRFVCAIWAKVAGTWDQIWQGLERGEFSTVEEYSEVIDELYRTGWDYYQRGDFDKAEREWRKILSIDPKNKRAKSAIRELRR